jgi:hypothetical protein
MTRASVWAFGHRPGHVTLLRRAQTTANLGPSILRLNLSTLYSTTKTLRPRLDNMVPSPKLANANKKLPFSFTFTRFHYIALLLGCSFFLLLWHRGGPSENLGFGFDNELHKHIKVHHRSNDPLFVCINQIQFTP